VGDRSVIQRNANDILFRCLNTFTNGLGHFTSLTHANPNMAFAVAHYNDRAEAKAPATFNDLGDAVNLNDALFKLKAVCINAFLCHMSSNKR
jgi:hypothetical protein